ncbi:DUF4390 domain-containing protein [Aquariibacter albus]|uniref:DUF4390 domain-containing protein n=1 Tax=Aquariibacter albus TaxID=2759899 RepID=UPI002E28553C|nr:DUF4390 domain-containing protein [Aquariibacter albus]
MPCAPVLLLRRLVLLLSLLLALSPSRAAPELGSFELRRPPDEGLLLSYSLRLQLPAAVEDALLKGVPLHFLTEVEVYRERWYWRDERVARQSRAWRLAWQPLVRRYRLSLGGFSQQHDRLDEALAAVLAASRWQVAEAGTLDEGSAYRVEFDFRLDTSRLPRPLQFSVDREDAWELELHHRARLLPRESR